MVRRTKEEAEKTRDDILKAAEHLFYTKGVIQTSLQEIAQEAGVTRGAVYWHFKDKVDLLSTIADSIFLPHEALLEQIAASKDEEPLELLLSNCLVSSDALTNDPRQRRIFTILTQRCEYIEEMDRLSKRNQTCRERLLARFADIFKSAEKKGQLAEPWTAETAAQCLHYLLFAQVHIEMEWVRPSRQRDKVRRETLLAFFKTLRHTDTAFTNKAK